MCQGKMYTPLLSLRMCKLWLLLRLTYQGSLCFPPLQTSFLCFMCFPPLPLQTFYSPLLVAGLRSSAILIKALNREKIAICWLT